jgi:hypothetical protein
VVNPPTTARLPPGLVSAVRGFVRVGFDVDTLLAKHALMSPGLDSRPRGHWPARRGADARATHELDRARALVDTFPPSTRERLAEGVRWAILALYESTTPTVRMTTSRASDASKGSPAAVAVTEIGYRLVIAAGTAADVSAPPDDWAVLDRTAIAAPAAAWPPRRRQPRGGAHEQGGVASHPWFVTQLLVPDSWLSTHADRETLAHWADLTGRSGGADRYWFPDAWDRFLEPGRRVGWLTANDVWRARPGRLPSAATPLPDEAADDDLPRRPRGITLTPDLERGVGVPPGYALVQCAATLEVSVVFSP